MHLQPGWRGNSCGYHADDGNLYHKGGIAARFGPMCTDGDRMGCGIDFSTDQSSRGVKVFFTKNGKQVRKGRRDKKGEIRERGVEEEGSGGGEMSSRRNEEEGR